MLIYSPELKKVLAFFCIPLCVSTRDIFSSPFGIVYLDAHTYRFVFKFLKSFFHRLVGDKDANYTEVLFLLQVLVKLFFIFTVLLSLFGKKKELSSRICSDLFACLTSLSFKRGCAL